MELLPTQMLQAVPHVTVGIFNLAIPNLIAWAILIGLLLLASWARMPKVFGPKA
jgi:hypothetical protein